MTLKEFLLKYCPEHMISVAEVTDDGIRFHKARWEFADTFLNDDRNSELFDREVVDIQCVRGEVLHINVKGE